MNDNTETTPRDLKTLVAELSPYAEDYLNDEGAKDYACEQVRSARDTVARIVFNVTRDAAKDDDLESLSRALLFWSNDLAENLTVMDAKTLTVETLKTGEKLHKEGLLYPSNPDHGALILDMARDTSGAIETAYGALQSNAGLSPMNAAAALFQAATFARHNTTAVGLDQDTAEYVRTLGALLIWTTRKHDAERAMRALQSRGLIKD